MDYTELLKVVPTVNEKIIKETLMRMGVANTKTKVIYPSCYLILRDGDYYLAHFKELFLLRDGGYNNISDDDINRRNAIAWNLVNWGLIESLEPESIEPHDKYIYVVSYSNKGEWRVNHKINTYAWETDERINYDK